LHVLQWLRNSENPPCPWDSNKCLDLASDEEYYNMVEWIQAQEL
jgi:hypothetical protein